MKQNKHASTFGSDESLPHTLKRLYGAILIESEKVSFESMLSLLEFSRKKVKIKEENALIRLKYCCVGNIKNNCY